MLPKIKRFIKNNKKIIKIGLIVLLIIIILLVLYKSLFYSSSEKATYGVRLRDIDKNKIQEKEISNLKEKSSIVEGVTSVKITIKGRLIKYFVTFDTSIDNEGIKSKFNEMLSFVSEKITGYYDITFYAIKSSGETQSYPIIGYKHKNKQVITFDEL